LRYGRPRSAQWPQYIATELGWVQQDKIELDLSARAGRRLSSLPAGALNNRHSGFPICACVPCRRAAVKIIINDIVVRLMAFSQARHEAVADLKGKLVSLGGGKTSLSSI